MIKVDKDKFWNKCLSYIKNEISDQAYSTWFEGITLINLSLEELTIQVPNKFHYEWIEEKYRHLIDSAIKKSGSHPLVVNYSVVISDKSVDEIPALLNKNQPIPSTYKQQSKLNIRYVFDNFIEGKGNQFAKAAAYSVGETPGQTPFNPLLIYSNPGLGKTHLLQAIGNFCLSINPTYKVVYLPSEKFMHHFIKSIQNNKSTEFISEYRNVDVLLLDDVQFFQNKEQTQEQFFHLFNDLYQRGKQIVLTSDQHPSELTGLKDRLLSRFQSGLIVDVQPPDLETRIAILMKESEDNNLEISYEILELLATSIKADIRAMKGVLIRLLAISSLKNIDISNKLAKEVLEDTLGPVLFDNVSVDYVINYVSKAMKISEKQLKGKSRTLEIALARQTAMYLSRELTNSSLVNIGLHLGGRDHSTVIHACKHVEKKIVNDNNFKSKIYNMKNNILGK